MNYMLRGIALALVLSGVAAAEVNVGINIGVPPPPAIVVPSPPRLIVVPSTPAVQYAPDLGFDFFVYGGRYYTLHDNHWFVASAYNGPWTYVERVHVPRQVLVVPSRYYYAHRGHPHGMPPGQAKKYYRDARWKHEDWDHDHWDHDHDHGHGHGHGHGHHDD